MTFATIASIYDRFNDISVYEYWLDFTLDSLDAKPHKVLDLACGTGVFTEILAEFVDEIVGLDLDSEMIRVAQTQAQSKENLRFIQGNMVSFADQSRSYDLITCYLDSLCFLDSFAEVAQVFQEVYQSLNQDGVFLFDVWTPFQIQEGFRDFTYFDQDVQGALLWQSYPGEELLEVDHHLTVFDLIPGQNVYQRFETNLRERTYPFNLIMQGLVEAGFNKDQLSVLVDYGQKHYNQSEDSQADRWFFRCYK